MGKGASRWLVLALVCLWALGAGTACDSDTPLADGDLPPDGSEPDGDGSAPDGDRGDGDWSDGDENGDRDRPPEDPFVWNDETIGLWRDTPFCQPGVLSWKDDFEHEDVSQTSRWLLDPRIESNPDGDPAKVVWPATIFADPFRRFVISGDPQDLDSRLKPGRIYATIGPEANAFHMMTRLDDRAGANLMWLGHNPNPTGSFGPQIQLFHLPEPRPGSEGSGRQLVLVDETDLTWCEVNDLDTGWHRVELFRSGSVWRLDVNRVTRCSFTKSIDPSRPLGYLFVGLRGQVDDVAVGNCVLPPEGRACSSHAECGVKEVCGRDGVCAEPRSITCQSSLQCKDASTCIGERDGQDMIGDGVCSEVCSRHENCRPSELCVPHTKELGSCHSLCREDGTCPQGQSCWEIGGVRGCLQDACKRNGEWSQLENGLLECVCSKGFVLNPFNNRCEFRGGCKRHSDCGYGAACGSDRLCHRSRDIACNRDESCPQGTRCYGFVLNELISGSGVCLASCRRDEDCLAYESCIPASADEWFCMQRCTEDSNCPSQLACMESYKGTAVCMAESCQTNGIWEWSEARQQFVCTCVGNTLADPNTGRCL